MSRPSLSWWFVVAIVLYACNLRMPITAVGPVIPLMQQDLHLSASTLGLLLTLPLLAFALVSPLAPKLHQRMGLQTALALGLVLIILGFVLRFVFGNMGLFAGTLLLGVGISLGNVLLPSLIKQYFGQHIALMTSVYAFTMGVAAATGSMSVLPISQWLHGNWSLALLVLIVFPIVSLLLWLPYCRKSAKPAHPTASKQQAIKPIWKHALAWQVTAFMGINSMIYYSIITWLPSILQHAAYTPLQAGQIHGYLQLAGALPGFLLVPLIKRCADQRLPACLVSSLMFLGLLGLMLWPQWAIVWAVCIGFGSGGTILLGLMFMGLRTHTPFQAASLSAMAQSIGYLLAAITPPLFGWWQQQQQHWHGVLLTLCVAAILVFISAFGCGRQIKIPNDV